MIFGLFSFSFSSLPINKTCNKTTSLYDCGELLFCSIEGQCKRCQTNLDCAKNYICTLSKEYKGNICSYEPLSGKWNSNTIISMISLFLAGIMVSGAGIGGGGLFVPMMLLIMKCPSSYAIPTTKAIIFGGAFAVTLFNLKKKHPYYDRPLINFNIAAMIEPISWIGTTIGVVINQIIPEYLLYILQFILLTFTSINTFKKGIKAKNKKKGQPNGELLLKETNNQSPAFSVNLLYVLFISWLVFLIISFLKGGEKAGSIIGVKFCSSTYWWLTFGPYPVYILLVWIMIKIIKNYPVLGNNNLTTKGIFAISGSGFVAGIASGFLGIGGGMVKGPLMLSMDIEPEEMAATSSLMILLTSSATSIQYIALGVMPFLEFFIFTLLGFFSFLIGIILIRWLVKKIGNRSPFLFSLSGFVLISAILMSIIGIQKVIYNIKNEIPMGFKPFCSKK